MAAAKQARQPAQSAGKPDPIDRARWLARIQCTSTEIANALAVEYAGDAVVITKLVTREGNLSRMLATERCYGHALLREKLWQGSIDNPKSAQWLGTQYLQMGAEPLDKRMAVLLEWLDKLQRTDPARVRALAFQLSQGQGAQAPS